MTVRFLVSVALVLAVAPPAAAQTGAPAADQVHLWVDDAELAQTLAAVWQAIDTFPHEPVPREGGWVVPPQLPRGRLPPPTLVPAEDIHGAVRRLFQRAHQRVTALEVEAVEGGGGRVTVQADGDLAVLVITGDGLDVVPPFASPHPYARPQLDGAGYAVRHLGAPSRDAPRRVPVPPDARVTLITRSTPIDLTCHYEDGRVWVEGVPNDPELALTLTLDGAPLAVTEPSGERAPGAVVRDPSRGPHRVRAELRRGDELVAWAEGTFHGPARYSLRFRAGGDPACVTLDSDAVAHRGTLHALARDLPSRIRLTHEPGEADDDYVGAGTRVCAWAPFYARSYRDERTLALTHTRSAAVLEMELEPLPNGLRWGLPALALAAFLAVLGAAFWPRRRPRATHLAWRHSADAGYRDDDARRWIVCALPEAPTPLAELDPRLAGAPHTVARGADDAWLLLGRPAVVGAPGSCAARVGDVDLPPGAHVLDGPLHLVALGEDAAARLRDGEGSGTTDAPSADERAAAMEQGVTDAPPRRRRASKPRVALGVVLGAALAAALPYLPVGMAELALETPPPGPGSTTTWLAGLVVAALAVVGLALRGRRGAL